MILSGILGWYCYHYFINLQGVPIKCPNKVPDFQIEVTPEIFGLENQFWYFWKAEACIVNPIGFVQAHTKRGWVP